MSEVIKGGRHDWLTEIERMGMYVNESKSLLAPYHKLWAKVLG